MSSSLSSVAIKVENLGKKYIIHHEKKESYKTFQDVLVNGGKKVIRALNPFAKTATLEDETREEFWALNDVNFTINKGRQGWHHRTKRCREIDTFKSTLTHHRTNHGKDPH